MPNTTTNTPNTALPFLIVGQGIAGTAIAFELLRRGYGVVVIDDEHREAASAVAAGIVNPITGKRFAKSWNMERILAAMPAFYAAMARWVGDEGENGSFFAPKTILRALRSAADENTWLARSAWDGWREYVGEHLPDADDLKAALQPAAAFAAIAGGGKVDIARAVRLMQAYLRRVGAYHAGRFDYSALVQTDTGVQYGSIAACAVVFCEGANVRHNPYFNYLPLQPSKGEALAVLIPEYAECFEAYDDFLVKNAVYIAPETDGTYWIGATNDFDHVSHSEPTEAARAELEAGLRATTPLPFHVVAHRAAIRPSVVDRRPLVGRHPTYPNLYILNGLGTKGASLAPLLAMQLADLLTDQPNATIEREADIARFG